MSYFDGTHLWPQKHPNVTFHAFLSISVWMAAINKKVLNIWNFWGSGVWVERVRLNRVMIRESDQPAQKQTRTTKGRKKQKTQGDRQTLLHAVVYFFICHLLCWAKKRFIVLVFFSDYPLQHSWFCDCDVPFVFVRLLWLTSLLELYWYPIFFLLLVSFPNNMWLWTDLLLYDPSFPLDQWVST